MAFGSSPFTPMNLEFAEALYVDYLKDPSSVPESFRLWFDGLESHGPFEESPCLGPTFTPPSLFGGDRTHAVPTATDSNLVEGGICEPVIKQERLGQLVHAYRVRGHLAAKLDPLGLPRPKVAELEPEYHGLNEADMPRTFSARTIFRPESLSLREIIERLKNTYCRSIGVQFMHIGNAEIRQWLMQRMEASENRIHLSREDQIRILTKLTDAVMFEEFLQTKYIGAKIFSLEGSESLVPLLNFAIDRAADSGVNEVFVAMAHRGRLNVLANIMGKSPHEIFREFEDREPELFLGSGDVKYHLGYRSTHDTSGGKSVDLSLCFNPSHLEYVNPVALGRTRARQDREPGTSRHNKLAILIHGDAAVAGEGIVPETLNLSELGAYTTGGAIHIVVNNQIGFTTTPVQGRSTTYATDVAKMLDIPIFHVNGEDPEAVTQVVGLALEFRERFGRDVFIDMYGYRRHGHNEGDEPAFTQPLLYTAISRRKGVRDGYLEHLLRLGGITREEAEQIAIDRHRVLEGELSYARSNEYVRVPLDVPEVWQGYQGGSFGNFAEVETALDATLAGELLASLTRLPDGFKPHRKIERLLEQRLEMAKGERKLDWGAGESLAMAALLSAGTPIRFTGQDCERGTFSHRHAAIHNVETGEKYFPLAHLSSDQARIEIHNSPLSEAAVLGFEYGFSLECPDWLVIWEAQFGDFWNVAQVVVDQFIVSAEDKWKQLSGITLLLPHGYEGMGPEHSSARIERWMMLAAEDNIQICQPSTPAQMFHLLRRQALTKWRKPLIVFTPKSLLRHPKATSAITEFSSGRFEPVIHDDQLSTEEEKRVRRVLLCTGKAYYSLQQSREELGIRDVAIVRIEQLYPLSDGQLRQVLERYPAKVPVLWVQEEPENMGAWRHFRARFGASLFGEHTFDCVARVESASPATGSSGSHRIEQEDIINRAFAPNV